MTTVVDDLLSRVARRDVDAVTGELAVAEVMVGAYRAGDPDVAERARNFFRRSGLLAVVGHGRADYDLAARIRAERGLPLVDAVHLATAVGEGCTHLVTNDARMPSLPGLEVLRLQDLEELHGG